MLPYVDKMFQLFNDSYASLQSFVPINDIQIEYFKKKYISFINPEFIKFVMDKNDKMVAFSIVICPILRKPYKKPKENYFQQDFYIY